MSPCREISQPTTVLVLMWPVCAPSSAQTPLMAVCVKMDRKGTDNQRKALNVQLKRHMNADVRRSEDLSGRASSAPPGVCGVWNWSGSGQTLPGAVGERLKVMPHSPSSANHNYEIQSNKYEMNKSELWNKKLKVIINVQNCDIILYRIDFISYFNFLLCLYHNFDIKFLF